MSELPRGLRNRNPGNIRRSAVRYKGETESDDAAFKTPRRRGVTARCSSCCTPTASATASPPCAG